MKRDRGWATHRTDGYAPLAAHILVTGATIAYILVFIGRNILPEKYFRDSTQIEKFLFVGTPTELVNTAFGKTAALYDRLHLTGGQQVVGIIGVTLFLVLVLSCLPRGEPKLWQALILGASMVLAGVYLSMYSKELFVLPLMLGFVWLKDGRKWEAAWVGAVFLYASILRANWTLVGLTYIAFRLILWRSNSLKQFAFFTVLLIAGLAASFRVVLGEDLHFYRSDVSENLSIDINTGITDPIVGGGIAGSFANGVYSFVAFMFPFPLVALFSPTYIIAAGLLAGLWWTLFNKLKATLPKPHNEQSPRYWRTVTLLLSYTLVQSLYAPDWGSYIRHMTPLVPLAAWMLGDTALRARDEAAAKIRKKTAGRET